MAKYVVIHEPAETDTEVRYFGSRIQAGKYFRSLPGQAYLAQVVETKEADGV